MQPTSNPQTSGSRYKPMRRIELLYLVVLLFLLVIIFAFNIFAGTTITSPQYLAIDLASPPDSPQDWIIQSWPVVKYRALFRLIVRGTWQMFFAPNDAWSFYIVFVSWSFFFFCCTIVTFYFYLRLLDFDRRLSFIGGLLFLASPPVLLAYKYPVYTREDVLAYLLVLLGLIAIFTRKPVLVALISAAAALVRETTMIVPLAYFLGSGELLRKRILVFVPPVAAMLGLRFLWGWVVGNSFESSILNYLTPLETIAFLFCVFGLLWVPYVLALRERWQKGDFPNYAWKVLALSGPLVLAAVMGATLTLARAREARITFILFPWAIPFALDWFRTHADYLRALVSSHAFWLSWIAAMGLISALVVYFHLTNPELMRYYLADFKNGYWLFLGALHLSTILAIFGPMLRRQMNRQSI